MALRGGNALNSGSARKSAKFLKPKKKTLGKGKMMMAGTAKVRSRSASKPTLPSAKPMGFARAAKRRMN